MRTSSCFVVVVLGLAACGKGESKPAAPPPTSATAGTAGTGAAAPTPSAAPAAAAKLLGSCAIADIACSDYYGSGDVTPLPEGDSLRSSLHRGQRPGPRPHRDPQRRRRHRRPARPTHLPTPTQKKER